jgi:hypothetical protein
LISDSHLIRANSEEIVSNQCQLVSDRLRGDQKVVRADWLSDGLEISSDRAGDFQRPDPQKVADA